MKNQGKPRKTDEKLWENKEKHIYFHIIPLLGLVLGSIFPVRGWSPELTRWFYTGVPGVSGVPQGPHPPTATHAKIYTKKHTNTLKHAKIL